MRRIVDHPILGKPEKKPTIQLYFEGKAIPAIEGEPIAVALYNAGILNLRKTKRFSEHRGIYCGIGQCQECSMNVDGIPHVRTCVTKARDGMVIEREQEHVRNEDIN